MSKAKKLLEKILKERQNEADFDAKDRSLLKQRIRATGDAEGRVTGPDAALSQLAKQKGFFFNMHQRGAANRWTYIFYAGGKTLGYASNRREAAEFIKNYHREPD